MIKVREFKEELKSHYKEPPIFWFKECLKMLLLNGIIESKCWMLCNTKEHRLLLKKSVFTIQIKPSRSSKIIF